MHNEAVAAFTAVAAGREARGATGRLDQRGVCEVVRELGYELTGCELREAMAAMVKGGGGAAGRSGQPPERRGDEGGEGGEVDFLAFYDWWAVRQQQGDQAYHARAAAMFNEAVRAAAGARACDARPTTMEEEGEGEEEDLDQAGVAHLGRCAQALQLSGAIVS
eukprot:COSAG01_NODE_4993_length_4560_cov_31.921991_3_plen_164_part_00